MTARLRLISGIVLYVYVGTHLLNHALGIYSLETLEAGRLIFIAIWRNVVGTVVLYTAFVTHVALVILALYQRRSLRMPVREVIQVSFGLLVPPILMIHIWGTRLLYEVYDVADLYAYVLANLWVFQPWLGVAQAVLLVLAWAHGTLGLHFWLRLKPWYPRVFAWVYPPILVLPVVALVGYADGGRMVARLFLEEGFIEHLQEIANWPSDAAVAWAYQGYFRSLAVYLGLLALVIVARFVRWIILKSRPAIVITYPSGQRVSVEPGTSILEASRQAGIPHASVCGGRGRCSTCRVHVGEGREAQPAADEGEARVLVRVGASPATRLACQLRPTASCSVTPLLAPDATARDGHRQPSHYQGAEREIAILFADIRKFTTLSEQKLPYDVVFVLNQYFRAMGSAIEGAGGRLDKFIGDGVMALFGVDGPADQACREALIAARRMAEELQRLNESLKEDLAEPLRIGIGIHVGNVIVGDMGYARARSVTAIGDAVNTASRLESMTKDFGAQLVLSERVAMLAGLAGDGLDRRDVEIRGRAEKIGVIVFQDAAALPTIDLRKRSAA
ncbi:MAG: adenylate/guanylate cyclase domain-containing protein [Alphaproteobacteria bacterium]|nr:adenylate/guanylate cyclase domain-containing protein [Alphaproteobacteria bacterium]